MQYLNIMKKLDENKLVDMLTSEDLEIRKVANDYIINNYDLDFTLFVNIDELYGAYYTLNNKNELPVLAKDRLYLETNVFSKYEGKKYITELIHCILEYNGNRKR